MSQGTVQNVGLPGAAITGGEYSVGGLVGLNYGTVTNSYVTGTVTGSVNSTGGLVGLNYGTISGSYMDGTVHGNDNAGGLVGHNYGTIDDSYAMGSVSGAFDVGGLVGDSSAGTIDDSYATSGVQGINNIGGLAGWSRSTIENTYATGSVSGNGLIGGLLGNNYGTVATSYSAGAVSGNYGVGGLVGSGNSGAVSHSFWDVTTSGQSSSRGGTGLTTSEMQTVSDLAGLDFTTTPGEAGNSWVIVDTDGSLNNASAAGATLPMLASEYSTVITNTQQLQLIDMAPAASYSLAADIDATATDGSGGVWGSSGFVPLGSSGTHFTGTFDGQGHTISNLTISQPSSSSSDTGLFGYVGSAGLVADVALAGASVAGYENVGALVGYNAGAISNGSSAGSVSGSSALGGLVGTSHGTITNSSSAATVSGASSDVGGLAGRNYGTVSASHATGNVTNSSYGAGGLVGASFTGSIISGSYATGNVTANGAYGRRAGGLVGAAYAGAITDSYATGSVSGNHAIGGLAGVSWGTIADSYATGTVAASDGQGGGLVGVNLGPVSDSYATGAVSGSGSQFGGLAGGNGGAISNSYATGAVAAPTSYVGGLVGGNYGTVSDSYSTGAVTGSSQVGGLVGGNQYGSGSTSDSFWDETSSGQTTSAGGTALTTAQMQQQSSFAGWDFVSTWTIYAGNTEPLLQFFMTPLTVTASNATLTYDDSAYSGGNGMSYSATPNSNLLGTLTYGGSAQGAVNVGTYTITPGVYSDQQGYLITYVDGTLTVSPATLTYAASATSATTGQSPSGLTGAVTGFVGSDTLASATSGTLTWTTPATASSPAGSYAIDGGGLTAANYVFTQAPANATALTLTAAAGNSGGSSGTSGSSGNGGESSGNPGGSSTTPGSTPPQSLLDAIAAFDAGVLPALDGNESPPSGPGAGGRESLRVESYGVRLPKNSLVAVP